MKTITSGCAAFDVALGGGYPCGRVVELFGPKGSGKAMLGLHAIAAAQRIRLRTAWFDASLEFPLDVGTTTVDLDTMLLEQPETLDEALYELVRLARRGDVELIVVDGIERLIERAQQKRTLSPALLQRAFSRGLRELTAVCHQNGVTVVFVTDLRSKVGQVFGNPPHSPNALKFYASVRVDVRPAPGDRVTRLNVVKNKCAAPFQSARIHIQPSALVEAKEES